MGSMDAEAFAKYGPTYEGSPHDKLRKVFVRHVITPLAHAVFAATVDASAGSFYSALNREEGVHVRSVATVNRKPVPVLFGMAVDKSFQAFAEHRLPAVVEVLTPVQRLALYRYFVGGSARNPNKALMAESSTVMTATGNIAFRHHELGLQRSTGRLINFWGNTQTPHLLRGFASGGNGFADGLRAIGSHEMMARWQDPLAPVLDTSNPEHLQVHTTVRAASKHHRDYNENLTGIYPEGGLTRIAMQYSVGCPARFLGFSTDVPELAEQRLALTQSQLDQINTIGGDVFEQMPSFAHNYLVRRDSYAGMCGVLATGVSIAAGLER
jgi:hypothetical protein